MKRHGEVDRVDIKLQLRITGSMLTAEGPSRETCVLDAVPRAALVVVPADKPQMLPGGGRQVWYTPYAAGEKSDIIGCALSALSMLHQRGWMAELLLQAAANGLLTVETVEVGGKGGHDA